MAVSDDRIEESRGYAVLGGLARARALTRKERTEIARLAANARWSKMTPEERKAERATWKFKREAEKAV